MVKAKGEILVAPCGLHCDICTMYRVYKDKNPDLWQDTPKHFREQLGFQDTISLKEATCEGCRSDVLFEYCKNCNIRKCVLEEKGLNWCYECEDFPCEKLIDFQSYWRMPIVENLREIKAIGVDKWLERKSKKWQCAQCGTKLHWFSFGKCPKCGQNMPDFE